MPVIDKETENTVRNPGDAQWSNNVSQSLRSAENVATIETDDFSDIVNNYDKTTDDSKENRNISKTKQLLDREKDGGIKNNLSTKNNKSKISAKIKKRGGKGPTAIIGVILLVFGIGAGTYFGGPSFLFPAIQAMLTNSRDTGAPARNMRSTRYVASILNGSARATQACQKPKSMLCRVSTISEKGAADLEKNGSVELETEDEPKSKRKIVRKITIRLENGKKAVARTGDEFKKKMGVPMIRSAFNKGFNGVKRAFLGNRYSTMLSKRFKVSKSAVLTGKSKEALAKSFRSKMGLTGDLAKGNIGKRKEAAKKQFQKVIDKTSKLRKSGKTGLGLACGSYFGLNAVVSGAKLVQITNLVKFAMSFMVEFDRARAGDSTETVTEYIGSRLNYSESNEFNDDGSRNRFYNTTFSDAEGMRMLMHGDIIGLSKHASSYVVGGGTLGKINTKLDEFQTSVGNTVSSEVASWLKMEDINNKSKKGKVAITQLCKLILGIGLTDYTQCAIKAFSGPWTALACVAIQASASILIGLILKEVISHFLPQLEEMLANMHLDEDTKGIDAGNAIAAGVGLMLQHMGMSSGLVVGTAADFKNYVAKSSNEYNDYIASERFNARSTPFDANNQYSFLGSLIYSTYTSGVLYSGKNPVKTVSSLVSSLPLAFKSVGSLTSVGAAKMGTYNVMREFDEEENRCPDPTTNQSFSGDPFCVQYTYMKEPALATEDVVNFLEDGDYISKDDGKPTTSDNGNKLRKFNKYCATRNKPAGMEDTSGNESGEITALKEEEDLSDKDDDFLKGVSDQLGLLFDKDTYVPNPIDWENGYNCTNPSKEVSDKELAVFSAFTMDKEVISPSVNGEDVSPGHSPERNSSGVVSSDGWGFPTDVEIALTSGFGPRWGGEHRGVDLAGPLGEPIYAAYDGEVIKSGPAGGFGHWIVIKHDIDGRRIDTVYGHMYGNDLMVDVGDKVKAGDQISKIGNDGGSTGPHLHFEVWDGGRDGGHAIDPWPIIGGMHKGSGGS